MNHFVKKVLEARVNALADAKDFGEEYSELFDAISTSATPVNVTELESALDNSEPLQESIQDILNDLGGVGRFKGAVVVTDTADTILNSIDIAINDNDAIHSEIQESIIKVVGTGAEMFTYSVKALRIDG